MKLIYFLPVSVFVISCGSYKNDPQGGQQVPTPCSGTGALVSVSLDSSCMNPVTLKFKTQNRHEDVALDAVSAVSISLLATPDGRSEALARTFTGQDAIKVGGMLLDRAWLTKLPNVE